MNTSKVNIKISGVKPNKNALAAPITMGKSIFVITRTVDYTFPHI